MISARDFAETYTSFWQISTPTSETLIREANRFRDRFAAPLEPLTSPRAHSFVADVAFDFLRETYSPLRKSILPANRRRARLEEIVEHRHKMLSRTGSSWMIEIENTDSIIIEAQALTARMAGFFLKHELATELLFQPTFRGCGIISDSFGDVIAGRTLYEIKTGDRPFRSVDLRQTLVYAALNYAARAYTITHLAILNPRLGTCLRFEVDNLSDQLAGKSSPQLFGDIIHFISADTISV
jgi:hypothetical protein